MLVWLFCKRSRIEIRRDSSLNPTPHDGFLNKRRRRKLPHQSNPRVRRSRTRHPNAFRSLVSLPFRASKLKQQQAFYVTRPLSFPLPPPSEVCTTRSKPRGNKSITTRTTSKSSTNGTPVFPLWTCARRQGRISGNRYASLCGLMKKALF